MSVDVFGWQLQGGRSGSITGQRGPAAEGFKVTADGQYHTDNRRLCNLRDPISDSDAVSVKVMKNFVQQETHLLYNITSSLRNSIDDVSPTSHSLESRLQETIEQQKSNIDVVQEFIAKKTEFITFLDEKRKGFVAVNDTLLTIQSLRSTLMDELKELDDALDTTQELIVCNTELIGDLHRRLIALENEQRKSSSR